MTAYEQAMYCPSGQLCKAVPDMFIRKEDNFCLIYPNTDKATDWIADNVDPDAPRWNCGVIVNSYEADQIIYGALHQGLIIE